MARPHVATAHAATRPAPDGMGKALRIALLLLCVAAVGWLQAPRAPVPAPTPSPAPQAAARDALPAFLPPEAQDTLALIARGGPFPHRQDGTTFRNREGRLPQRPRGYYREYTVRTPGERTRGARRIVTGGDPPVEFWYTADHYESFRRFEVRR